MIERKKLAGSQTDELHKSHAPDTCAIEDGLKTPLNVLPPPHIDRLLKRMSALNRPTEPSQPCPTDETLRHYKAGALPADQLELVTQHLAECSMCLDMLVTLDRPLPQLSRSQISALITKTAPSKATSGSLAWLWPGLGTCCAVVLMLMVLHPRSSSVLPEYAVQLTGDLRAARGDTERANPDSALYRPDSDLVLKVLPPNPAALRPDCVVYTKLQDGSFEQVANKFSQSVTESTGLIQLRARADAVFGEQYGDYTLLIVLSQDPAQLAHRLRSEDDLPSGVGAYSFRCRYRATGER